MTREHLDELIAELDRRRHAATDVPEQLRKHPVVLLAGAALTVAVLVGVAVAGARRREHRRALPGRVQRLREAVRRIAEHPERVAARKDSSIARKVLLAAATSAAATVAKRLVQRRLRSTPSGA